MSTRSLIVVHGQDIYGTVRTVRLYKHSDGYPTGALEVIQQALEAAQRHQHEDKNIKRINVSTMVGLLIGAGTSEYGMGVVIDQDTSGKLASYGEAYTKGHLGDQGDIEWVYIIDTAKKTVSILGGGYTGKTGQSFKLADPYGYAAGLRGEYQEGERQETDKLIQYIEAWGFKVVCKKPKATRGAK